MDIPLTKPYYLILLLKIIKIEGNKVREIFLHDILLLRLFS